MIRLLALSVLTALSSALYPPSSDVIELTPSNFDKLVLQSKEVWLVEFFAPWCGHCRALVPEYTKAAAALKGVIKVGAVDVNQHSELGRKYAVNGFPTIKIFGANKNRPEDYSGGRVAQNFVDGALHAAKAKVRAGLGEGKPSNLGQDVVELTDANFDKLVLQSGEMWLVEFFAPWCGHCQNLAPHWAQAATELKGKMRLGALDATLHKVQASKYRVEGYPTIKFFSPGKKVGDYDGGRSASGVVTWAMDTLSDNAPAPEVSQLINRTTFEEACDQKPLCVVAFLPHILDCQSKCRGGYLTVLKQMGEKYKKQMWGWVWSEAGAQLELEGALDIGGFGYPAMVVINGKKMKYSSLRGAFSKDGINEFLRDLSYGRGSTSPVKGKESLKIVNVEAWDRKDGKLPQEEDVDLSDVKLDSKEEL